MPDNTVDIPGVCPGWSPPRGPNPDGTCPPAPTSPTNPTYVTSPPTTTCEQASPPRNDCAPMTATPPASAVGPVVASTPAVPLATSYQAPVLAEVAVAKAPAPVHELAHTGAPNLLGPLALLGVLFVVLGKGLKKVQR